MKIKIGKYEWTVKYIDDSPIFYGNTNFGYLLIKINKKQKTEMIKDTIFHETIHAYIRSYGFNKEYFYEEDVVTFITQNIDFIIKLSNEIYKGLEKENKNDN